MNCKVPYIQEVVAQRTEGQKEQQMKEWKKKKK